MVLFLLFSRTRMDCVGVKPGAPTAEWPVCLPRALQEQNKTLFHCLKGNDHSHCGRSGLRMGKNDQQHQIFQSLPSLCPLSLPSRPSFSHCFTHTFDLQTSFQRAPRQLQMYLPAARNICICFRVPLNGFRIKKDLNLSFP